MLDARSHDCHKSQADRNSSAKQCAEACGASAEAPTGQHAMEEEGTNTSFIESDFIIVEVMRHLQPQELKTVRLLNRWWQRMVDATITSLTLPVVVTVDPCTLCRDVDHMCSTFPALHTLTLDLDGQKDSPAALQAALAAVTLPLKSLTLVNIPQTSTDQVLGALECAPASAEKLCLMWDEVDIWDYLMWHNDAYIDLDLSGSLSRLLRHLPGLKCLRLEGNVEGEESSTKWGLCFEWSSMFLALSRHGAGITDLQLLSTFNPPRPLLTSSSIMSSLTCLKTVQLDNATVHHLRQLTHLPALQQLVLHTTWLHDLSSSCDNEHLPFSGPAFPHLTRLDFLGCTCRCFWTLLPHLPSLNLLHLKIHPAKFDAPWTDLNGTSLAPTVLRSLRAAMHLALVDRSCVNGDPAFVHLLTHVPLESLSIMSRSWKINTSDLLAVRTMTRLTSLELACEWEGGAEFNRQLKALSCLTGLKHLVLQDTDAAQEPVAKMF